MAEDQLSPFITVKIGDQNHDILMSFGLLNEISRMVGAIERVAAIDLDSDLAELTLIACLCPRDAKGRRSDAEYALPVELSPEVAEAILDWAKEHVLAYFTRRLKKNIALLQANKTTLSQIGSSLIGLDPSISTMPSFSPSASPRAD